MRVAFAGTPDFARTALAALLAAGHRVPLVLTQPDRPAGRGLKRQASAVKQLALQHALPLAQPRGLRLDGRFAEDAAAARDAMAAAEPEVMVVAAYGLILPPWVLALPRHGCLNIHGSLLPRWRGAAPVQRAIEAGDAETGITLMQMDAGLDTGALLLAAATPIGPDDTGASLSARLAEMGAESLLQGLALLSEGGLRARPQPAEGVTYAHKIAKSEAAIDWEAPAPLIENRLRAFDPFPGASTTLAGLALKVWRGRVAAPPCAEAPPGRLQIIEDGRPVVACGDSALELLEVQLAGGRRMSGQDFVRRHLSRPAALR